MGIENPIRKIDERTLTPAERASLAAQEEDMRRSAEKVQQGEFVRDKAVVIGRNAKETAQMLRELEAERAKLYRSKDSTDEIAADFLESLGVRTPKKKPAPVAEQKGIAGKVLDFFRGGKK